MSQGNQAQHSDYSYNNDKSVPTSFQRHRLPHHPRERKDQKQQQQSYIPTIDSVSTGSAPRELPHVCIRLVNRCDRKRYDLIGGVGAHDKSLRRNANDQF
jgi:hypothetical protein